MRSIPISKKPIIAHNLKSPIRAAKPAQVCAMRIDLLLELSINHKEMLNKINATAVAGFMKTYPGMIRLRKSTCKSHPISTNIPIKDTTIEAPDGKEICLKNRRYFKCCNISVTL
jgi:hypothetical protein